MGNEKRCLISKVQAYLFEDFLIQKLKNISLFLIKS